MDLPSTEEYRYFIRLYRLDRLPDDLKDLSLKRKGIEDFQLIFLSYYIKERGWELRTLDLSSNRITVVPDFNIKTLELLDLEDNLISTVPDFSSLPNLETLNLYKNRLKEIPDFSHLPKLEELFLSKNKLTEIPRFTHLVSLGSLDLSDNKLTKLPDLSHLTALSPPDIRKNRFVKIPDGFTYDWDSLTGQKIDLVIRGTDIDIDDQPNDDEPRIILSKVLKDLKDAGFKIFHVVDNLKVELI